MGFNIQSLILPKNSLAVKRENGILQYEIVRHEDRADCLISLIQQSTSNLVCDFDWILFSLDDKPTSLDRFHDLNSKLPFYQPCTSDHGTYEYTCPDAFYHSCKKHGVDDYEEYRVKLMAAGVKNSQTQALGWLGAITSDVRKRFVELAQFTGKNIIFYRKVEWDVFDTMPDKYMSMVDQAVRFKYLIDMEGIGYSPRLKLQFFSFRPIFIVDSPWRESFYKHLVPWVHYIPVKSDLSNLVTNLQRIESDKKLYTYIRNNMTDFAQTYLTRDNAISRFKEIFIKHAI